MKKTFLIILAIVGIMALISCNKNAVNPINNPVSSDTGIEMVSFHFEPYNIEPIRDASSIGDYCNHLDVYIYESDDLETPVSSIHQVLNNNSSFGTVIAPLQTNKTYTMYAIAHKCNGEAVVTDGVVLFPEGKTTHSFFYKETFTPTLNSSKTCTMERIVGMFKMTTTDAVPSEVSQFVFVIDLIGTAWNVEGYSENKIERTVTFNSFNLNSGGTVTFNLYLIADEQDETNEVNITTYTYGADEQLVQERYFENVPIKNGWMTTYTGNFFVSFDMNITFLAEAWNEFDPVNFING